MILIGDGGHARDIRASLLPFGVALRRIPHHKCAPLLLDEDVVIGINDPRLRAEVADELGVLDRPWVHPDARLYVDCTYGHGTHINYGVTMTRTTIGHHTTISPGVTICGDVVIGDRVMIGAGATIVNLVTIGDDAVIGAGAVVLKDVPAGAKVKGIPAR